MQLHRLGWIAPPLGDESEIQQRPHHAVAVPDLAPEREGSLVQRRRPVAVTLLLSQRTGAVEGAGAKDGRRRRGARERSLEPRPALAEVTAEPPETPERGGQPQL
jgi:hypothetical protein